MNGQFVYRGYGELAGKFFLAPVFSPVFPTSSPVDHHSSPAFARLERAALLPSLFPLSRAYLSKEVTFSA